MLAFISLFSHELATTESLLATHDVQYENATLFFIVPIDDATRRLNNLTIAPSTKLPGLGPTVRMCFELVNVPEGFLNKLSSGGLIFKCGVVRNSIQVCECGFSPNYFNHRAILALAWLFDTVRPSSMARSPRAMPSSNLTLARSFS